MDISLIDLYVRERMEQERREREEGNRLYLELPPPPPPKKKEEVKEPKRVIEIQL